MDELIEPVLTRQTAGRRFRSSEEKQRIIEEALVPGASVAAVARAHGINANMLFSWRKMYRAGLLNESATGVRLLPVRVREEKEGKPSSTQAQPGRRESSLIEVRLAKAQVRIEGAMDAGVVRAVLESLLR
jgi:transposase